MNKLFEAVTVLVGTLAFLLVLSLLFAWPVSLLWNYALVPAVTGLHEVTVLQMWAIMVLCNVLFKPTKISKE